MSETILVVGGNAAGMTAASRAKRLRPDAVVTVVEAGPRIAYSICGLPYHIGGDVARLDDLVYFTPETLKNERGIDALVDTRAVALVPGRRSVVVENVRTGERRSLAYDRLLVATGYRPRVLPVEGVDAEGVFTASRLEDAEGIDAWIAARRPVRAVLVGAGYVGLEMAEALRRRGLEVTLVDAAPSIFPAVDEDVAALVRDELEANGVRVLTNRRVVRLRTGRRGVEEVELAGGSPRLFADLVFVDVGVEPRTELAETAGLRLGPTGAIAVSERMETSVAGIYAAGNCAETTHLVTGRPYVAALGTVAAKQGRVAGENMAGRRSTFRGAVGTTILRVFRRVVARTGLTEAEARRHGFRADGVAIRAGFRAEYFSAEAPATVKVVADRESRRLLGVQIVGSGDGAVRIDAVATALAARMTVDDVAELDLAYAPPVGTLWSPLLVAMNAMRRRWDRA